MGGSGDWGGGGESISRSFEKNGRLESRIERDNLGRRLEMADVWVAPMFLRGFIRGCWELC